MKGTYTMSFGSTIKKLRRSKELTQEELADILSISPQAVSRWETDAAMPDISLLPALCNFFGVTSDFLLGIDVARKKEQIKNILDQADKLSSRGYLTEARALLEDALKKYPDDYKILQSMINITFNQFCRESDKAKRESFAEETILAGEKILKGCTEDDIRQTAIQILCLQYPECGKRDKARELAMKMPSVYLSRECLLSSVEKGSRKHSVVMNEIFALLQILERDVVSFNTKLDSGEMAYTAEERIVIRDKAIALIKLFFENGDYGFFNDPLQDAHIAQARAFAKKSNREMTLYHLTAAAECAVAFIAFANTPDFVHTSLVFRGSEGGSFGTNSTDNSAQEMLNKLAEETYDFVRDDPKFVTIMEKLKINAGKWTV